MDELTGEGIEVHPYHDLDHSDWTGERDPIVLGLILGIASSAAWDAIKLLLHRRCGGQPGGQAAGRVKVTVGFRQGDQIRWAQVEGDGPAVAAALDRLNPWQPPSP